MTKMPSVRTYSCSTFYSRAVSMCVGAGAGWGGVGVVWGVGGCYMSNFMPKVVCDTLHSTVDSVQGYP